ncbi:BRCA1-A complex subunit Abraxas 1-like [Papaver somniferum]|uniref:BRCA1-A complex subunit Abraxas 1-like n=1 Tax=Papaver somniferum TaxID=3469 RepID=UPI000E702069|nr:BRCA1-A complex subunit Abraxas 1-like [Papaver somniferum]
MAEAEDLPPLQKISISGPTLTSIIQRFSSSPGDVDGLLYGHITSSSPLLEDDVVLAESSSSARSSSDSSSSTSIATITGFFCSGTVLSFYNSLGQLNLPVLQSLLSNNQNQNQTLIGWFVGRRRTCLRPSMREFSVCKSLATKNALTKLFNLPPVFMIFTTPVTDQTIHTHDYQAFQFRRGKFEAKTVDVVNIGPAFRGHYNDFEPNSVFPLLPCVFKGDGIEIGGGDGEKSKGSLSELKEREKGQKKLDNVVQGFEVGRLSKLMGSQAMNYTQELEALYEAMLMKLEGLARVVEKSNEKVIEQELRIGKMRNKFAGLE